jgi:hypothetical protein
VWTVNRATNGRKSSVVDRTLCLLGTDDFFQVADNALLNIGFTDSFTVVAAIRLGNTSTGFPGQNKVVEKANATTYTLGYSCFYNTTFNTSSNVYYAGGVASTPTSSLTTPINVPVFRTIIRDVSADLIISKIVSNSAILTNSVNDNSTGTGSNTNVLRIGANSSGVAAQFLDFEFFAAAVFRRVLSDAELNQLLVEMNAI